MLDHRLALGVKDLDTDNIFRGFSQGQALGKIWRAHQKKHHLNEISKLGTAGEKEQYAINKGGSYSDELLQELSARRSAQAKANLTNFKTRAEIDKINAEASSKNADANEKNYGVSERRNKSIRKALGGIGHVYDINSEQGRKQASTAYMTTIGELTANGVMTPKIAQQYQRLFAIAPQSALNRLKTNFLDNPDIIRALTPKAQVIDNGGQNVIGAVNPVTKQWEQHASFNKSVDPTQQANYDSRYAGQVYAADQGLAGKQYTSDNSTYANMYKTQQDNAVKVEQMNRDELARFANANNGKPLTANERMKLNDKIASGKNAVMSADSAIQSATELLNHPGLNGAVGFSELIPNRPGSDASNFVAKLENMKSQLFLPAIQSMKGMGALSEQEGAKLQAAIQNLDPRMSESAFKQSLNQVIVKMNDLKQLSQDALAQNQSMLGNLQNQTQSSQTSQGAKRTMSRARAAQIYQAHGKNSNVTFNQFVSELIQNGVNVR